MQNKQSQNKQSVPGTVYLSQFLGQFIYLDEMLSLPTSASLSLVGSGCVRIDNSGIESLPRQGSPLAAQASTSKTTTAPVTISISQSSFCLVESSVDGFWGISRVGITLDLGLEISTGGRFPKYGK